MGRQKEVCCLRQNVSQTNDYYEGLENSYYFDEMRKSKETTLKNKTFFVRYRNFNTKHPAFIPPILILKVVCEFIEVSQSIAFS